MDLQGSGANGISLQGSTGAGAGLQTAAPTTRFQNPITVGQAQPTSVGNFLQGGQQALNSSNDAIAQSQQTLSQGNELLSNLQKQIQGLLQANKPPVAPTLNLNAIYSAANQAAASSVNPLYTQQLNEYLQNEAAAKAEQQQQNQLAIQGAQTGLAKTLAGNQLTAQEAASQNALQQANINTQSQNYQLQSGSAQNQKLAVLQQNLGSGNLAGSGLGAQQLWEAENAKNVADAQQQGQFQYNRDVANQSATNTFNEMNLSSGFAQKQETAQEAASNFSLNSYLRQAAFTEQQYRNSLEAWKQQALAAASQNSVAQQVQQQLQQYRNNPGVYQAAVQAYSPQLQAANAPSMVNALSYQP